MKPSVLNLFHPMVLFATIAVVAPGIAASSSAVKSFNKALGKGVNLGNELESPSEGTWGPMLDSTDLSIIAARGFNSVRAPIRWDGIGDDIDDTFDRALRTPPYTIDPRFFVRVDSLVTWARRNHLLLILNDHHHDSLLENYEHELPRFLSIWEQVSNRYKDLPSDSVAFEILNEPVGQINAGRWNWLLDTTLKIIRTTNPVRPVLIGTADWGGTNSLGALRLPLDSNLILTIHDYDPKPFVYQGASWMSMPKGVAWGGYWDVRNAIEGADMLHRYATAHDIPVNIGEFGTTLVSDSVSRHKWIAAKTRLYENRGFSWAYWNFKEREMGLYSMAKEAWNDNQVGALFSTDTSLLILGEPPTPESDLIFNGQFDRDTGWILPLTDGGKATLTIDSGFATIDLQENPTQINWAASLCQKPIPLRKGQSYLVTYSAWADSATTIDTWIGKGVNPWPSYMEGSGLMIGPSPKTFRISFQMPSKAKDDSVGELCINLGLRNTRIHIDSVQFLSFAPPVSVVPKIDFKAGERVDGNRLTSSSRPVSRWLVDARGAKVRPLDWHAVSGGWTADLADAPRNRLLFADRSGIALLLQR